MARPIPKKKSASKFHEKPSVRKKHRKPELMKAKPRELRPRGWMIAGFDTSMSSIAGAAIGYDGTLKRLVGPEFLLMRWSKDDEYLDRLKEAAMAHEIVHELQNALGLLVNVDEVYIAQEEPAPMGMFRQGVSAFLKQQCEVSGAFLGGLMRYGYTNVFQINSISWRTMVAEMITEDTGEPVTTHHSKWKSQALVDRYNCKPGDSGKFRTKQWALDVMAPYFGQQWGSEIPDWPDIIESADGKKPRPENSKAKSVQPDDRYDALAVMWSQAVELRKNVEEISW